MIYEVVDLQNSLIQSPPFFSAHCSYAGGFHCSLKNTPGSLWYCSKASESHPEVGGWVLAVLEQQLRESQLNIVKCVATP